MKTEHSFEMLSIEDLSTATGGTGFGGGLAALGEGAASPRVSPLSGLGIGRDLRSTKGERPNRPFSTGNGVF